jgi:hypothetical protein
MKGKGLLFPHGEFNANEIMIDYLDDNQRRLMRVMAKMGEECLHWTPDPGANSIAVTIWHMGRLMDVFLTQLVLGEPSECECWIRNSWAERTNYDPRGLGRDGWGSVNGYTADEVAAIPRFTKEQLLGYIDDVYKAFRRTVGETPMADLADPAPGFEKQYTKYQVLSMALLDNVRHLGEVYTLKATWGRISERRI